MSGLGISLLVTLSCVSVVATFGLIIYMISVAKPGANSPIQNKQALQLALLILVISFGCVGAILWLAR